MAHALRADLAVMSSEQGALPLIQSSVDVPGYGYLLGMHAFGLEETANYSRAEDVGRHALNLNPRDPWADTALSYHNGWHLALHHLELDDRTSALDVYDRLVHPSPSAVALELVDASQLLWRIALRGGDVGALWGALADCWAAQDESGFYAFSDVHALIAYNAAGRDEHQRRMLVKLEKCADGVHTNAGNTRELALPLARAIVAISAGRDAEAVELLLPIRSKMNRIGGSHAQHDLVQLTCIEAALRCGSGRLARALDVAGNAAAAKPVREHAELRRLAQLRRNAA